MVGEESPEAGSTARRAIEGYLRTTARDVLRGVVESARVVAEDWDEDWTTDREAVVGPLERELGRRGLGPRLVECLVGSADAAGLTLLAPPVPGPPYLVVTSTGPVLRGTNADARIVVGIRVFEVERGVETRYRHRAVDPSAAIDVSLARRP